jgi:hypothetical protein
MEQRNGRIDRTLQPSEEVRCHYFTYPDRTEDRVLEVLVGKVETIRRELGSLGTVIADQVAAAMDRGIGRGTRQAVEDASRPPARAQRAREELEGTRALARLKAEVDEAGSILKGSRKVLSFDPELLRQVLDQGLVMAGAAPLAPMKDPPGGAAAFTVPELPDSWGPVLDGMRPPRGDDEPYHLWTQRPPRPVVFEAPEVWSDDTVHLHLEHPFVHRILARFRSQGFSAHDLSRVTVLPTRTDDDVRAVAIGRLSLFGPRATRLHDELVVVAAPWFESKKQGHLVPGSRKEDDAALRDIERSLLSLHKTTGKARGALERTLLACAADDFAVLWKHVRDEADERARLAEGQLARRGREEALALRKLLQAQQARLTERLGAQQLEMAFTEAEKAQREQWENDKRFMEKRRRDLDKELVSEPPAVEALYTVARRRLVPVGLVYLWPETRG